MTRKWLAAMLLAIPAVAAEMPLPDLRIEPTNGGSVFYIRNNTAQPLKAYLIELVDYPGSSYSFWQDETVADPLQPKGERRIQVANMTVGAVPDYVKMRAALYEDGSTAGVPEKVAQLMDRRRVMLETVRQVVLRMESAQDDVTKAGLSGGLKRWADTLQPNGEESQYARGDESGGGAGDRDGSGAEVKWAEFRGDAGVSARVGTGAE